MVIDAGKERNTDMILTNYWWLLIWLFVVGEFCVLFFPKQQIKVLDKMEIRWGWPAVLLLSLPYVIWAVFRPDSFGDTAAYRSAFNNATPSLIRLLSSIDEDSKDKGFSVLMTLMKALFGNSDVLFFLLIAAFQLFCVVYIYRKYSSDFLLCFFLFIVSTDYMSWMHNGIRQFIAATAITVCFGLIVNKKYLLTICIILLVSTIHMSALIMIPIVFIIQGKAWNKKTILFILVIVITMAFIDRFTPFLDTMLAETQYSDIVTNEIWTSDDGTNIIRVLVYSAPALLSLIGKKYIDYENDRVINICVNCSCITMALYLLASVSSGIYIGRLPIYTTLVGYIAVPWLIDHMFTIRSAQLIKFAMIGAYLIFFYYQMHVIWRLL